MENGREIMQIARPAPVREQVVQAFQNAVFTGYYAAGQRITERELAESTGASRTSVREALRDLETLKMVERPSSRELRVAKISPQVVRNVYEVRRFLEPAAVALFVERASDEHMDALRDFVLGSDQGVEVDDFPRFEEILLAGSGNEVLAEMLNMLRVRVQAMRRMTLTVPGRSDAAWREIRDVATAIVERDAERAADLMRVHVAAAEAAALEMLGGR